MEERAAAKSIEDAKAKVEAEVAVAIELAAAVKAAEQEQKQQQEDQSTQKEEKELDRKSPTTTDVVTTGEISCPTAAVIQSENVQLTAHQQSLMDESGKMSEYLRKEGKLQLKLVSSSLYQVLHKMHIQCISSILFLNSVHRVLNFVMIKIY